MRSRRVRVVVVNFNGGEARACAASTPLSRRRAGHDGRDRGGRQRVDRRQPRRRCAAAARRGGVPSGTNLGFVANNLALADLAGLDYVALVNNDAFVDPGWLDPLVDALETDSGSGACSPRSCSMSGVPPTGSTSSTTSAGRPGRRQRRPTGASSEADEGQYDEPAEVFAWCGGSVLLRPRTSATSACSTSASSSTTRTPTCRGGGGRWAGATATCPTRWCATCTRPAAARPAPCSATTTSATGWWCWSRTPPADLARRAALRHPLSTLSYLRRALVEPSVTVGPRICAWSRVRARAYAGFLRLVPWALAGLGASPEPPHPPDGRGRGRPAPGPAQGSYGVRTGVVRRGEPGGPPICKRSSPMRWLAGRSRLGRTGCRGPMTANHIGQGGDRRTRTSPDTPQGGSHPEPFR